MGTFACKYPCFQRKSAIHFVFVALQLIRGTKLVNSPRAGDSSTLLEQVRKSPQECAQLFLNSFSARYQETSTRHEQGRQAFL